MLLTLAYSACSLFWEALRRRLRARLRQRGRGPFLPFPGVCTPGYASFGPAVLVAEWGQRPAARGESSDTMSLGQRPADRYLPMINMRALINARNMPYMRRMVAGGSPIMMRAPKYAPRNNPIAINSA